MNSLAWRSRVGLRFVSSLSRRNGRFPGWILAIWVTAFPNLSQAAETSLRQAAVIIDVNEASYVHHTAQELRQQVQAISGVAPPLSYDLKEAWRHAGPLVVVGRAMAARVAQVDSRLPRITNQEPGEEGFILKALRLADFRDVILAAGSDSKGTNYALMQLRQLLAESSSGLAVTAALNLLEKPRYRVRGLYLHQHWRYNYPYATWSWTLEDWKRALDMAAYLRVNLVLLWMHMDVLAPPLSIPEQEYLAQFRQVVDYAHRKRGLKVGFVEPPNVMLNSEGAKRLPMERRDYYAYANPGMGGLHDPGDPQGYATLMSNRETFYRAVPNADGYGYIDSDPGRWDGSPTSALLSLFEGDRRLLDQYHQRPQEAELLQWVWGSWGIGTPEENWRNQIEGFKKNVKGPKRFLLTWAPHVTIAKEMGYLGDSVFLDYGVTDDEPVLSQTSINFPIIKKSFDWAAQYPEMQGVMASTQTFLTALPNLYYFMRLAWSAAAGNADEVTALRSLAKLLYPERADLLSEAWAQLKVPGSGPALALAARLQVMVNDCQKQRLGVLGGYVFPEPSQVPADLVTMLTIHARAERVREQVTTGAPETAVLESLEGYLRAVLDWQAKNGFHGAYGVGGKVVHNAFIHGPNAEVVKTAWKEFTKARANRKEMEAQILNNLSKQAYTRWIIDAVTAQLFGTYRYEAGELKPWRELPASEVLRPWARP